MAARLATRIRGSPQIEATQDWKAVVNLEWLRFVEILESKPLKIGKRLLISNVRATLAPRVSRDKGRPHILIPASVAFGTGGHTTTAMSLRLLERLTRKWEKGWS